MKTKIILLGIFSLLTFTTYSQAEKDKITEPKLNVTELKVETENLNELKNFDWNRAKYMFQENEENQEITLAFTYLNKSKIKNKYKVRIDDFKFKVSGKTAEIDNLIKAAKSSIDKLISMNEKYKN